MSSYLPSLGLFSLCAAMAVAAPVPAPATPDYSKLTAESVRKWSGAETVVLAKIEKVLEGPMALSDPPIRNYRLQLAIGKVLRSSALPENGTMLYYNVRQRDEAIFPDPKKDAIVVLSFVRGNWSIEKFEEATAASLEQATLATSLPLGWTLTEGKLVSPWASLGKPGKVVSAACSVSGRPAWMAGEGIEIQAKPVPGKVKKEFANPDGDGEYTITVKNTTDKEVKVPALRSDGKDILWMESLVIRCGNKAYAVPGAKNNHAETEPAVLKPGESVKGTVNVFALVGPNWPKGGDRIEFQFCLGEMSATQSFYYLSKHHDPIREATKKALAE